MSLPPEYGMLQKKIAKEMMNAIGDDLVDIIVYGSAVEGKLFSGVSDNNFIFVIKDTPSNEFDQVVTKIAEIVKTYRDNPMFATMIQFQIMSESQMASANSLNGIPAVMALALKEGVSLKNKGSNPYKDLEINKEQVKENAISIISDLISKMVDAISIPSFDEEETDVSSEKDYLAIENGLLATQIYMMAKKMKYVPKSELDFMVEDEEKDNMDYELVKIISTKRQGADFAGAIFESDETDDVTEKTDDPSLIYNIPDLFERTLNHMYKLVNLIVGL